MGGDGCDAYASASAAQGHSGERSRQASSPAGTVGGTQLTMDALYASAVSDVERVLEALDELAEKVGLDAGKIAAAKLCISDGLGYLREAGEKGVCRPSGRTG